MRISTSSAFTNASSTIGGRQSDLAKLSTQISSGKRIILPSDDPEGAARAVTLEAARAHNDQLRVNQRSATNILSQAESLLGNINDAYSDIRAIMVQAGNPALADGDRLGLAAELAARSEALYGLSVSRDADGQPLFGGRVVEVGSSRALDITLNSSLLFGQVRSGNGVFAAAAASGNAGAAAISAGTVSNATALDGNNYDIVMHNTAGTITYDVVNITTSTVVSSGNAFTSGADVTVAGMSVSITGAPADNDRFHLTPSVARPVFQALDEIVQALRAPVTDQASRAKISAAVASGLAQLDQASETAQLTRASTGAALQELETLQNVADGQDVQLRTQLAEIQDLDYSQAATELAQHQLALETAQKAYSRILGRTLFDYL